MQNCEKCPIVKSYKLVLLMKIETAAEEVWALAAKVSKLLMENEILREELRKVKKEAKNSTTVIITTQVLQGMMKEECKDRFILIPVKNLERVLKDLENMDQVRLVSHTMQKMLPKDAEAEMVKLITDATPDRVNDKELIRMDIAQANDIVTGGSSKFVNHYSTEKGGPEKG